MANKFTRFLNGVGTGLTNPKGIVSNWKHATRIFVDDTFRLSPRSKFLFYVSFEIDEDAHRAPQFKNRKHGRELGLLVKSADLPKYNFDSVVKNQYNRKKVIYKNLNYEPVNITMHDDNAGLVNAMWAIYYGYYVADRANPAAAFEANHYRPTGTFKDKFRYGLDNGAEPPFFKSVSVYTMSRRRFLGYTLVNPKIKSWNHGTVSYAEGDFLESQLTLEYESVRYSAGDVRQNSPKGFATLHYDTVPSPLSVAGGGVANLLGDGGVLDGLESIFGDISNGNAFSSFGGFLGTAIASVNTYKNFKGLSKDSLKNEAINILSNPRNISSAISTVGGLVGTVFPKSSSNTGTTTGTQKTMIATAAFTGQPVTAPDNQA
jgi:hypothetical protein